MEIIAILQNLVENILTIFIYLMPFWLFDSASYFIDIYSNPLFITLLFILTLIMWFIFLVYFIELLNIPLNLQNIQWTKMIDEDIKNNPTFLTELLNFIFWKSNFGTFYPIVITFLWQIRFKIIPIIIILLMLYVPLMPTSRWYNTVWEFYFANRIFIAYTIVPSLFKDKYIEKQLKYAWLSNEDKLNNNQIYKDTDFLLKELSNETIENSKLNYWTEQEVKLYENVYDKKSYDIYISSIDDKIKLLENKIKDAETKKDNAETKADLTKYINLINNTKKDLENILTIRDDVDSVYKWMSYTIDMNSLDKYETSLFVDKWYNEIILKLVTNTRLLEEKKVEQQNIEMIYENTINKIKDIKNWDDISVDLVSYHSVILDDVLNIKIDTTWTLKEYLKAVEQYDSIIWSSLKTANQEDIIKLQEIMLLNDIIAYISDWKNVSWKLNEIEWLLNNAKKGTIENQDYTAILWEKKKLLSTLKTIDDSLNNIWGIETNAESRINYIIEENANILASYPLWDNEEQRQALLLLQYKLLTAKDNIDIWTTSIKLLWNRVEYVGIDLLHWFWLVLKIITFVFTFIWYTSIVLMAWWKNMLLLYISLLNAIMSKIEKFISWTKTWNALESHISNITNAIFPNWQDRELNWFNENKH